MTRPIKYSFLILVSGLFYLSSPVHGQVGSTLYHMYGVPQANHLNPAFQPQCKGHLGLPMLSPLNLNIDLIGFSYGDIFTYNDSLDQMITFMHPKGDKDAFIANLKDLNMIDAELRIDPVSIGWRRDKFYFTLDWTIRAEQDFRFTRDFVEFALNQVRNQQWFSFGGMGVDVSAFHEIALGFSYQYEDNLSIGARGKLLLGLADMSAKSTDITLKTDEFEWEVNASNIVRATVPYLDVPVDENGKPIMDSIDVAFPDYPTPGDLIRENLGVIMGARNPGFAVDFGFMYRPVDFLSVSASVNDLGFIRWRRESYTIEQSGRFTFEGVEVDPSELLFGGDESDNGSDVGEDLFDSISDQFDATVTKGPYTSMMTGKGYFGVAYEPLEWVRLGIVDRIKIYDLRMYNQFTFSANIQPIRMFSLSLSYSVIGNYYANFGTIL